MKQDELIKLKELLDNGVITQEEFEQQKEKYFSESKKSGISEKVKIGFAIFAVLIICIAIIGAFTPSQEESGKADGQIVSEEASKADNDVPEAFAGECPVALSASIADNIIGVPELTCNIQNNTDKEILAVKLYFSPRDVYGEEVSTIFTTHELYTDEPIAANGSGVSSWQLLDQEIKSGDIYIYSVYFSDSTEWGNKDAGTNDVKKYGKKVEIH